MESYHDFFLIDMYKSTKKNLLHILKKHANQKMFFMRGRV